MVKALASSVNGIIENLGGPVGVLTAVTQGSGYPTGTFTGVELFSISGKGSGAEATIQFLNNVPHTINVTSTGTGYIAGETLGITTSSISSGSNSPEDLVQDLVFKILMLPSIHSI